MNPETLEQRYNKLRVSCHNNACTAFGYSYIFDKRVSKYSRSLNWLKWFGIFIPTLVGLVALSYEKYPIMVSIIIGIATPLTIIQFLLSSYATLYKWDDELIYAIEASTDYFSLSNRLKNLANYPPDDFNQFKTQFDLVNSDYNSRCKQNVIHNITEKEERIGMRSGLREFQFKCVICGETPVSMTATECSNCGQF